MPRKLCLAIGVSDSPPLDYLPGAVNGARAIAAWATANGYETQLLTDETSPIGVETITEALQGDGYPHFAKVGDGRDPLLRRGDKIERLLIYFAGHGLSRNGSEDLWLLSEWYGDQRAVGPSGLRRKLQRFGVQQVTIVADACRSLPVDADSADLNADNVLGRGPYDGNVPMADILQASSKYRAAFMIPGETAEDDRCIFTGVLEEALWGLHDGAFSSTRPLRCITSASLARHLWAEVPARAQKYSVELNPEIQPGCIEPADVYVLDPQPPVPALRAWPEPTAISAMGTTPTVDGTGKRGWSTMRQPDKMILKSAAAEGAGRRQTASTRAPARLTPAETIAADRTRIDHARQVREKRIARHHNAYANEERPTHFKTRAGFAISGATARRGVLGPDAVAEDVRDATWWRIAPEAGDGSSVWSYGQLARPLPLLVELADGRWAGAAAMRDFIVTFSITNRGVESVIYRGFDTSHAPKTEAAVAALRVGSISGRDAIDYAVQLRYDKHADPILGVIASYLYDAQGDIDSIRQIAFFYASARQPIPFDVAMLAGLASRRENDGTVVVDVPAVAARQPRSDREAHSPWTHEGTKAASAPVAGRFPWLRQGWTLLEDEDETPLIDPRLSTLRHHLAPTPFVTLDAEGGQKLNAMLFGNG